MRIPVACTLTADAAGQRVDEWRQTLARTATHVDRSVPLQLRIRLRADQDDIAALVLLARQEKACCAFFSFTFEVEADWVTLVVEVPSDAAAILDDFAGLSRSH